jgi:hypothetical protein
MVGDHRQGRTGWRRGLSKWCHRRDGRRRQSTCSSVAKFGVDGVIRGIDALDALPMDPAGLLAVDRVTGPGGREVDLAAETVCAPLPPASCGRRWSSHNDSAGWGAGCAILTLIGAGRFGSVSGDCVK